ncbi:hypothetical protein GBAR_LOCUS15784 [Geodia barretti]|uniref:Uncharacterized protein n=1 Tax=Geodia barretti TaxID=519541 RepID=A0AA35SDX0_GEOBA|nr:hypothetical protein GBAR_LOCUS15784 [Geodia barretti]
MEWCRECAPSSLFLEIGRLHHILHTSPGRLHMLLSFYCSIF